LPRAPRIEIGTPVVEERFHVEADDRHRERRGGIGVQQKQADLLDAQSTDRQIQHRLVSMVETRVAGVEAEFRARRAQYHRPRLCIAHRERLAPESSGTRAFHDPHGLGRHGTRGESVGIDANVDRQHEAHQRGGDAKGHNQVGARSHPGQN
jgi:hypothetical protein